MMMDELHEFHLPHDEELKISCAPGDSRAVHDYMWRVLNLNMMLGGCEQGVGPPASPHLQHLRQWMAELPVGQAPAGGGFGHRGGAEHPAELYRGSSEQSCPQTSPGAPPPPADGHYTDAAHQSELQAGAPASPPSPSPGLFQVGVQRHPHHQLPPAPADLYTGARHSPQPLASPSPLPAPPPPSPYSAGEYGLQPRTSVPPQELYHGMQQQAPPPLPALAGGGVVPAGFTYHGAAIPARPVPFTEASSVSGAAPAAATSEPERKQRGRKKGQTKSSGAWVAHKVLGRPVGTTRANGFKVGSRGGRRKGTTRANGYKVSGGRPKGTTAANGYRVSPGRPRGTTAANGYRVGQGRPRAAKTASSAPADDGGELPPPPVTERQAAERKSTPPSYPIDKVSPVTIEVTPDIPVDASPEPARSSPPADVPRGPAYQLPLPDAGYQPPPPPPPPPPPQSRATGLSPPHTSAAPYVGTGLPQSRATGLSPPHTSAAPYVGVGLPQSRAAGMSPPHTSAALYVGTGLPQSRAAGMSPPHTSAAPYVGVGLPQSRAAGMSPPHTSAAPYVGASLESGLYRPLAPVTAPPSVPVPPSSPGYPQTPQCTSAAVSAGQFVGSGLSPEPAGRPLSVSRFPGYMSPPPASRSLVFPPPYAGYCPFRSPPASQGSYSGARPPVSAAGGTVSPTEVFALSPDCRPYPVAASPSAAYSGGSYGGGGSVPVHVLSPPGDIKQEQLGAAQCGGGSGAGQTLGFVTAPADLSVFPAVSVPLSPRPYGLL